jgi:hypothetical protein
MDLNHLIEYGFMALVSGTLTFAVTFLRRISESITKLNIQVGVLLERSDGHTRILDNHERRIGDLEKQTRR